MVSELRPINIGAKFKEHTLQVKRLRAGVLPRTKCFATTKAQEISGDHHLTQIDFSDDELSRLEQAGLNVVCLVKNKLPVVFANSEIAGSGKERAIEELFEQLVNPTGFRLEEDRAKIERDIFEAAHKYYQEAEALETSGSFKDANSQLLAAAGILQRLLDIHWSDSYLSARGIRHEGWAQDFRIQTERINRPIQVTLAEVKHRAAANNIKIVEQGQPATDKAELEKELNILLDRISLFGRIEYQDIKPLIDCIVKRATAFSLEEKTLIILDLLARQQHLFKSDLNSNLYSALYDFEQSGYFPTAVLHWIADNSAKPTSPIFEVVADNFCGPAQISGAAISDTIKSDPTCQTLAFYKAVAKAFTASENWDLAQKASLPEPVRLAAAQNTGAMIAREDNLDLFKQLFTVYLAQPGEKMLEAMVAVCSQRGKVVNFIFEKLASLDSRERGLALDVVSGMNNSDAEEIAAFAIKRKMSRFFRRIEEMAASDQDAAIQLKAGQSVKTFQDAITSLLRKRAWGAWKVEEANRKLAKYAGQKQLTLRDLAFSPFDLDYEIDNNVALVDFQGTTITLADLQKILKLINCNPNFHSSDEKTKILESAHLVITLGQKDCFGLSCLVLTPIGFDLNLDNLLRVAARMDERFPTYQEWWRGWDHDSHVIKIMENFARYTGAIIDQEIAPHSMPNMIFDTFPKVSS